MQSGIDMRKANGGSGHRFDYKGMHRYVITLTTNRSSTVFTAKSVVLQLLDVLRESCWKHHFDVYAYCCLPHQFVMMVRGKTEYADMKAFLAAFRARSAEVIGDSSGHTLWKRTYTERVLRKKEDSKVVAGEIYQLPVKAGLASTPGDFPYQGSFVLSKSKNP